MKKLKEIVEVLSQIVALKCPAQDGGPGSGQKGHTSGKISRTMQRAMRNSENLLPPSAFGKTNDPDNVSPTRKEQNIIDGKERQRKYEERMSKLAPASSKLKHNNTPETLHNEGKGAARSQTKQADSPYEKGSPEHKHWLAGYKSYGHGGK